MLSSLVVGSDLFQGLSKDLESELAFFSIEGMELGVDLSGNGVIIFTSTLNEVSVSDVEVNVGKTERDESEDK